MKTNFTKKMIFCLSFAFIGTFANAQNGLENVIVEKYYVSNAADAAASIGVLPLGSVTYRIYADLLPGYKFQMAYGDIAHPLLITSSTSFFNNEDRGAINPTYTKTQAKNNTVMLDSWLSAGAACVGNFGVLKIEDNGVSNVVNSDGILQNTDASAGIPLTSQDGLILGTPGVVGMVGIDAAMFDATSQVSNSFTTTNGAWYCLDGAQGPDTNINTVLIAQITTDGDFSFQLNIQIGTPGGSTETYVANNPTGAEILLSSLTYNSVTSSNDIEIKQNNNNESSFSVFPNPSTGIFNLQLNSENEKPSISYYTIYNMIGGTMLSGKIENNSKVVNETIDISAFSKGIYYIEVITNGNKSVNKLIVK